MSYLDVVYSQDFSDQVLTVEPLNKTPALICRCLQALAEALKINQSVTNINLDHNKIAAEGAKAWCVALAEALKINQSVTKIKLSWNQIGDEGAKAWFVVGSAGCCGMSCFDVPDIL
eukprot:s1997_g12.t1